MKDRKELLAESNDMTPVDGTVDVNIPAQVLWKSFTHANWWPRWNKCFFWAKNEDLKVGEQLVWCFQPIRTWYLYKMPAIAKIVEVEENSKVTWEVVAFPGMYARHTYSIEDLGNGRTRFRSWEKAMGWGFRLTKWFWVAHFVFVRDRSLEGALALEETYLQKGGITDAEINPRSYRAFLMTVLLLLLILAGAVAANRFYVSYLRISSVELAPGIRAVLNGGCNSLVVENGGEVLVVDPKFPPGSSWFRELISKDSASKITKIVNTHYHFDHTEGNIEFPGASIFAYKTASELMMLRDGSWWSKHQAGLPQPENSIETTRTLEVGDQQVVLTHPGNAHTHTDLVVYLSKEGKEIVATGDIVFHGYYPFFDLSEGGADLSGLVRTIRDLANQHPNAVFVPGHGSLATAVDLVHLADYLEYLYDAVARVRAQGLTEDEAVNRIDVRNWDLSILPIFHYGQYWSTASSNIRSVYRLQARAVELTSPRTNQ